MTDTTTQPTRPGDWHPRAWRDFLNGEFLTRATNRARPPMKPHRNSQTGRWSGVGECFADLTAHLMVVANGEWVDERGLAGRVIDTAGYHDTREESAWFCEAVEAYWDWWAGRRPTPTGEIVAGVADREPDHSWQPVASDDMHATYRCITCWKELTLPRGESIYDPVYEELSGKCYFDDATTDAFFETRKEELAGQ